MRMQNLHKINGTNKFPAMAYFGQNQQNEEYGVIILVRSTTEHFLHILWC